MQNCLKLLHNKDIHITERVCLIINNTVLLTEHHNTYNFPGGKLSSNYLTKPVGTNSLKELKEELGITFKKEYRIFRLISWYFDNKKCLRLLLVIKVPLNAIIFKKATHVWESRSFTLVPLTDDTETNLLGRQLQHSIQTNNQPCATYMEISPDNTIKSVQTNNSNNSSNHYIYKENNSYFVKLSPQVNLTAKEKEYLKEINKRVTGFEDTEYIYKQDYICKYRYIPINKQIKFSISKQFLQNMQTTVLSHSFKVLGNYEDLIKSLYSSNLKILRTDPKRNYSADIIKLFKIITYTHAS